MLADFHQWSTAEPYLTSKPSFVGGLESIRVGSYSLYEQIYWTIPEAFKVIQRGSDDNPIYIPSGRQIVETMHRYLAPGFGVVADPSMGTTAEQAAAMIIIKSLFARERIASRFSSNKRFGIIRGDWLFRIMANPLAAQGSRISIMPVDPGGYFPVSAPDNVDVIIGCDIGSIIDLAGKPVLQKTSYRKTTGLGGPSPITVEEGYYEIDKSGLPGKEQGNPIQVTLPLTVLPNPIDQIPVYHYQNFDEPGTPWGSSEIRGLERLMGAVNQAITDEELALALEGLGVYYCDGGPPIDEDTGEEVPWDIGPARVIEVPTGKTFGRVQGITSVTPMQDHLSYLHRQMNSSAGIPEIAQGKVSVQTAESGIALLLEMGPLLASASEKEQVITDVTINMLYDLRRWFAAYEGIGSSLDNIIWIPTYADKLPINRKQKFDEILALFGAQLISGQYARSELSKIGYEFPPEAQMLAAILAEQTAAMQVQADVLGMRVGQGLGGGPSGNPPTPGGPPVPNAPPAGGPPIVPPTPGHP